MLLFFSLSNFLLFIGFLGIVWSIFLFTHKRGNQPANRFLGLLILVLAILLIRGTANSEKGGMMLFLYFLSHGFIFLIGPAIYFHIQSITARKIDLKQMVRHFLPAIIISCLLILVYLNRQELKDGENIELLKITSIIYISIQVLHLIGYLFYSKKTVMEYIIRQEAVHSSSSRINARWIKRLIWLAIILGGGVFALHFLIVSGGYYQINNTADTLFLFLLSIIVFTIIYMTWRQPEIISGIYEEKQKYHHSQLGSDESAVLMERLDQVIHNEKVFLNSDLGIKELAEKIRTPVHTLSQLINEKYEVNFFHFINGHRVDYARKKIRAGGLSNKTLEAIAYESGFNSKTTFNRAFKRKMNCSPREYLRSVN